MSQLLAAGGRRLSGEVTIQGAKNSVLPILAATLLTADTVVLRRCPRLKDVEASIRILEARGWTALLGDFFRGHSGPVRTGGPQQPRGL